MTSTATRTPWPMPRQALAVLSAGPLLWLPAIAQAQGSACDQLKATLAARIDATGVRGYSLEAVPASTPLPPGAKAIGNCEGGERKILYRRFGGTSAAASAPIVIPEPPTPKRQAPPARAEVSVPVLASAPMPTPKPATLPAPAPEPAKAEPVRPKAAETVRPVVPIPLSVASDASTVPAEPAPKTPPLSQRVSEFAITHWHWLLALLAVPLAAVGWAWRAHHLAYDKNGLPRGPRL